VIYAIYTRFTLGLPTQIHKDHKDLKNITYTCGDIDTYKSVGHAKGRQVEKCIGKFGRKSRCIYLSSGLVWWLLGYVAASVAAAASAGYT